MDEHIDTGVFKKINEGDFDAFRILFERYYNCLCNFASGYLKDDFDCEDIVQEVYVKIWEDRNKIRISSSIKSYLYTAVKNACLNRIKAEAIRLGHTAAYLKNEDDWVIDSDQIEQQEFRNDLWQCIEKLPPRCKEVFIQSRFEGVRQQELALAMKISVKTVKAQIGKALKFIKDCLRGSYPEFFNFS